MVEEFELQGLPSRVLQRPRTALGRGRGTFTRGSDRKPNGLDECQV